jgi:thioester reductase-like protein
MSSASAPGGFVVCVTGGAGFVGSHVVAALLLRADVARVVCTVSSLARSASSAAHLRALPGA